MKRTVITLITAFAVIFVLTACDRGGEKKKNGSSKTTNSALQVNPPAGAFVVDNEHSMVVFKIRHMGVGNIYGRFNDIGGYVHFSDKDPGKSSLVLKIDVNSVDTNVTKRDNHLRSPDFFDSKKFPVATFKSKSFTSAGKNRYRVTGTFELHGVKKEITTTVNKIGQINKDPWGFVRAGGETRFKLKRSDYGITGIDKKMPGAVGDDVEVIVSLEGVHK